DLQVVAEASDGATAVRELPAHSVDVVLMDIRMRGLDGIEATKRLRAEQAARRMREAKIVMLTTFDLDEYALAAIKAGASGFLLKDAQPEDLLDAIRTVYRGDAVIAPSTTRRLLDHVAPMLVVDSESEQPSARLNVLTGREREILREMAHGLSNGEI